MQEWKNVKRTRFGQEYVPDRELSSGVRTSCRAVFFRNTHKTTGEKIISLKIARTNKVGDGYKAKDEKAITLTRAELDNLICYIQEYYTPLDMGMTEFIAADKDAANLFSKVKELGISDEEVVDKLSESGILIENLGVAITAASRNNAIQEFENAIGSNKQELYWQKWFERNKWILGSDFLNILPERDIDVEDIADYLMQSIDGFLDVVEIKRSDAPFWIGPDSHGNLCPSAPLSAAIMQCLNYLYKIELQSNSVEFLQRVGGTKTVKPQCLLVYGRSNTWGEDELKALRILNASYHQLHIMTYDQLLIRAKQLIGSDDIKESEEWELPF